MFDGSFEVFEGLDSGVECFSPLEGFVGSALVSDRSLYMAGEADFEEFWAGQARELLDWSTDFGETLRWDLPFAEWFVGGRLNVSFNCLDRHVLAGRGGRVAFHFEGEAGDKRTITYAGLLADVERFANVLKGLGLVTGDRVAVYMPMIPELVVTMLACARIGVAHSVVFGGFSPSAIADRCIDAEAKVVVTADGGFRRGKVSVLKPAVDAALELGVDCVERVVVVDRCGTDPVMVEGRDLWWHELLADADVSCPAESMDAEQLLFLLYTSGTTAKPKGIMHTSGGFLTQAAFTHKYVFDIRPESDVFWCAADIGWITGHSYVVYAPLVNGCTSVLYEGTPDTPTENNRVGGDRGGWDKDRLWDIVERYGVTQLYTAPTAIRTFMRWGEEWPAKHDLTSLRVLGTVGEPINPEAWLWYHKHIGLESSPIVDTWWQTETGGHMISPLPGVTVTKPGSASSPIPGVFVEVVDDAGERVTNGGGYLTVTKPWPSMLRGIWGDEQRFRDTYWSRFPGRYFAGDGARVDVDGDIWILGRVDDVMNVSGHRISTAEVESALVDHEAVAEAAVVGASDELTGQSIVGYVILLGGFEASQGLSEAVRQHVATKLGPTCRPGRVVIVPDLPKTRSGKIMRRLLRNIAEGHDLGDITTLADPAVVAVIQNNMNAIS